ncbi:transcriptional regulator with XRE-family HTH domain [Bacillus thermophilus]|uniref:Transcriptional regulator with XRE-family HTH domain n=2 Tax=Siminovitchia thermophila TaxID=1245522 RepID=A0ABS2R8M7_9BACI|nr:transcriptional regulator with XRE-family HTH domain [Siminovitchia thermophila]
MARRLGYKTPSGYANIESGKIKLTLETALMISEIIEVDFHVLFLTKTYTYCVQFFFKIYTPCKYSFKGN